MDTFTQALMRMKLQSTAAGAVDSAGKWAVAFERYEGLKLYYVVRGEKAFLVDRKMHRVKAGECLLLTTGQPFVTGSDVTRKKPMTPEELFRTRKNGVMTVNGGGESFSIGTHFIFEGHLPRIVFAQLPPVIHIAEAIDEAALLRWSLERFRTEFFGEQLGRSLLLNHLAPIILMQVLRIYLSTHRQEKSWLAALADPKLSKAIDAIHNDCGGAWTLVSLAAVAGMSRSRFALHFKTQVGIAPMDYLTQWRMQTACELFASPDHNVGSVANAVGYESESAFSLAFRKVIKQRPGSYRRAAVSRI